MPNEYKKIDEYDGLTLSIGETIKYIDRQDHQLNYGIVIGIEYDEKGNEFVYSVMTFQKVGEKAGSTQRVIPVAFTVSEKEIKIAIKDNRVAKCDNLFPTFMSMTTTMSNR